DPVSNPNSNRLRPKSVLGRCCRPHDGNVDECALHKSRMAANTWSEAALNQDIPARLPLPIASLRRPASNHSRGIDSTSSTGPPGARESDPDLRRTRTARFRKPRCKGTQVWHEILAFVVPSLPASVVHSSGALAYLAMRDS